MRITIPGKIYIASVACIGVDGLPRFHYTWWCRASTFKMAREFFVQHFENMRERPNSVYAGTRIETINMTDGEFTYHERMNAETGEVSTSIELTLIGGSVGE